MLETNKRSELIGGNSLFGPEIRSGIQISPNGEFVSFLSLWRGTRNLWLKRKQDRFETARLLTRETSHPVSEYFWSWDGQHVIYAKDSSGNEDFNYFAVIISQADSGQKPPAPRNITRQRAGQSRLYEAPKAKPGILYVGLNKRNRAWCDLYEIRIEDGQRKLIWSNNENIDRWHFDLSGNLRLATRVLSNGDNELLRIDASGCTTIYSWNVFEMCSVLRFHPDGRRVYLVSNKGESTNLSSLILIDVETAEIELVERDPLGEADFGSAMFSESTDCLIGTSYYGDDHLRRYFTHAIYEDDFKWLGDRLRKEIGLISRTKDDNIWLVLTSDDTEPGEVYLFERSTRCLELQYRIRPEVPRNLLSPMDTIRYSSSDGLSITAYLTIPRNTLGMSLPTLVLVHDGPWSRDFWGFNAVAQFFASRGYAILMANFRGSTGYGKAFLNAGNEEWGRKMQDDITWGVRYLVSVGISDVTRIGILGFSYGGYAALAGTAFTPDLYQAAVDISGPANLITLIESMPLHWEPARKLLYARMGNLDSPDGRLSLQDRSPVNAIDKIRVPLLLAYGANDPRVKRSEADQVVVALRERGCPVEYLLAADEGHGFIKPLNRMALFYAIEKFLAAHLGGAQQADWQPNVKIRLEQMMVKIDEVTLESGVTR